MMTEIEEEFQNSLSDTNTNEIVSKILEWPSLTVIYDKSIKK
jgi:hypothetical protein